jgi:hypothetical protein
MCQNHFNVCGQVEIHQNYFRADSVIGEITSVLVTYASKNLPEEAKNYQKIYTLALYSFVLLKTIQDTLKESSKENLPNVIFPLVFIK